MLELDVLEQGPLNLLESSVSRAVTHRWPVLHVPFIHEIKIGPDPISDPGRLDQVALQVNVQGRHYLLPEISEDPKIPAALVPCARKDTGELFIVNSAVMLDTVEKASPMEICDPGQNMMLQESGESSALQAREDFFEITIARDHTDPLHVKDDHTLNDPVSKVNDNAAGMEVLGIGTVLQSKQSESVGNLPNEPFSDESSGLEISKSVKVLTETVSLAATKSNTSVDESPEGVLHDKCHQCLAPNKTDEDSMKCLEVENLSCLWSPSTPRTIDTVDFPEVPSSFQETLICKEPHICCIKEVCLATCLLETLEPNTDDDINASKENVPRDMDSDMIVDSVQQEIENTSSDKQNDISVAYLSDTISSEVAIARLQHIQSDTSKVENDSTSPGNLEDDLFLKPNLPPCFENLTAAKALDNEECSFSSSMSECNSAPDCHNQHTCANKESPTDSSDPIAHNVLCSAPAISICGEPSYAKPASTSSVDGGDNSFIEFTSHAKDSDLGGNAGINCSLVSSSTSLDRHFRITGPNVSSHCLSMETEENQCTIPQTMKLHPAEGTEKLALIQSKGLCDTVPAVTNNQDLSLKIVEDSHCLVDTEDSSLVAVHDVIDCGETMLSSHTQSDLLETIKETDDLKVPCPRVTYSTNETPSYALVPYIDIWGPLSKPEVKLLLPLRKPKNVIKETVESQEQTKDKADLNCSVREGNPLQEQPEASMEDCMPKAFKNPQEVKDSSHSGHTYEDKPILNFDSKMDPLLVQEVKCNVSAHSVSCLAECHGNMHDNRLSSVPFTINQSEGICLFNSDALCASTSTEESHNVSVLPKIAGDTLQSEQTNVCFLKENHTPHLSLFSKHLGDHSALLLPSLPEASVAVTDSKRQKSHGDIFLGNLQLHVTNHAVSSIQIQDDLSKSFSLKQATELEPRYISTLEEPVTASDPAQCVQISAADVIDPTHSKKPGVLNKKESQFMLRMENFMTHERKPSPGKADGTIATKARQVRSQRNVLNAEIKMSKKSQNSQLLNERHRQSTSCYMEKLSYTAENRKKYNLRLAPQSLNSTSQEAKRPKISNGKDVGPASSGLPNCADKFLESHHLSQPRQAGKIKEPLSAIRNVSCLGTNFSVKRQPSRKCKGFYAQESFPIKSLTQACNSSTGLKIHNSLDISVKYKSLPSKQVDLNCISKPHYHKMTRAGAVFQKPTPVLKGTQDQMLLNKLSKIANRLTAPSKASCTINTFSSNMNVIPFRGVKMQARKLLNVFSCVSMRMNSQLGQLWQGNVCLTSSRDRHVSQSMNLYPTSFHKTYFNSLGDSSSLNACSNLPFPVSFHVKLDPSCLSDFLKLNPPDFVLRSPPPAARSSDLSEWTLSLFLSSHMPADTGNVHLLTQWNPQFRSLESSSESSHRRKSVVKSGCSMLGLHTVLALSSPGCYRLWTRKRNLGSRIPTVQKLSVTQFAHGLKGSSPQFSRRKDQFSSLEFSLGRVLSTWSQHGLSAFSYDCASTHPNCSVWLPSQSSSNISVCKSPNPMACFPQLPLNPFPHSNTYSLPVQNLNLKPMICQLEDLGLPVCLSTQKQNDPISLCWLPSQNKNGVEFSSWSFQQKDGLKHSFTSSTVKDDGLNLPLFPSTLQRNNLERPLGLSCLEHDQKPVVNITLQKDRNLTSCSYTQCEVSIQEDAAVHHPCPEISPKGPACPFEQKEEIIIPCTQNQNKDQGNEKGSFERKPQRVSQIRIRKTIPKPDPNLTPMGLPKPKRVNKKEFSLEDIYTNKNYKSPPPARSLETIFEEPKEKNGILISVSHQKRKRILEFRDCTVPRVKRPKGKVKVMTSCKRGRKAAMEGVQLDALLIQKLMDLENCLLEEEAMERGSAASVMPS